MTKPIDKGEKGIHFSSTALDTHTVQTNFWTTDGYEDDNMECD